MGKVLFLLMALVALPLYAATGGGTSLVAVALAPQDAPTTALANLGAGLVTNGTHSYKFTAVNAGGESLASAACAAVTTATATNGKITVTVPALAADQVSFRVYRTKAGGSTYYLNDTAPFSAAVAPGTYTDNVADASLSATEEPASDTTSPTVAAPAAPVTALWNGGAGLITSGTHLWKVAYATASGIAYLGTASNPALTTATATNGKVNVTLVASADASVTGIYVYRTLAGTTTPYYLVNTTAEANSNGDYVDNVADATLVTNGLAPSADTASASEVTTISASSGKYIRSFWIRNQDATNACYVTLDGTTPQTLSTAGSWRVKAAEVWGPIDLPSAQDGLNVSEIKLLFDTGGGYVSYWYREDF